MTQIASLTLAVVLGSQSAQAQNETPLSIAVGPPGSHTFAFGIRLSSLVEVVLEPSQGIDLNYAEPPEGEDRFDLLRDGRAQLALVEAEAPVPSAEDVRSVIALWPNDAAEALTQLVVRADVADDTVYEVTKTIFRHTSFLSGGPDDFLAEVSSDRALTGLRWPLHPGARRLYEEEGWLEPEAATQVAAEPALDPPPPMTTVPDLAPQGKTFVVYFDFDDATLKRESIPGVAAACKYAAEMPSVKFVIGGHTDRVGPYDYNMSLALRRADAVATAIRSDERFRDALDVVEFGEARPAVRTDDDMSEPLNRRVEITVLPETADTPLLPMDARHTPPSEGPASLQLDESTPAPDPRATADRSPATM